MSCISYGLFSSAFTHNIVILIFVNVDFKITAVLRLSSMMDTGELRSTLLRSSSDNCKAIGENIILETAQTVFSRLKELTLLRW